MTNIFLSVWAFLLFESCPTLSFPTSRFLGRRQIIKSGAVRLGESEIIVTFFHA